MTPVQARDAAAWLYQVLAEHRLIVGSSGNVSARTPEGMLITPSGGTPEQVGPADLASLTLDGTQIDPRTAAAGANPGGIAPEQTAGPAAGDATTASPTPSSEWALHAAVYRICPGAAFIAHTHADACTALACLNQPLPPFHYMVVQFGGDDVRCAPYVTFGTQALADLAGEAIAGRTACLLANHGMIVCGRSATETLTHSILLETLCRQYLLARSAGTPRLLTEQEMRDARQRFTTYGQRSASEHR